MGEKVLDPLLSLSCLDANWSLLESAKKETQIGQLTQRQEP